MHFDAQAVPLALDNRNERMATADSWRGIQLVMRVTGGHAVNPQSGVAELQWNAPVLYRTNIVAAPAQGTGSGEVLFCIQWGYFYPHHL